MSDLGTRCRDSLWQLYGQARIRSLRVEGMRWLLSSSRPLEDSVTNGFMRVQGGSRRDDLGFSSMAFSLGWSPDFSDPATLGCLLALVREASGQPTISLVYCEAAYPGQACGWALQPADNRLPLWGFDYDTEAEALVAALEALAGGEG